MSSGCAAGERKVFSVLLPNRIEISFLRGHYGYKGHRPIWFRAQRGGCVSAAKTPWQAIRHLLDFEKRPVVLHDEG